MRRSWLSTVVLVLAVAPADAGILLTRAQVARDIVEESLRRMGGESRWRGLSSLRIEGIGHQNALEQSERPRGPWITTYRQFTERRDYERDELRRREERRGFWADEWQSIELMADSATAAVERGDRWSPAPAFMYEAALERRRLSPERILLTALEADDLRIAPDTMLQGVDHRVVTFTWNGRRVRLFVNAATSLPAGYAAPAPPGDAFAEVWGDAPVTTLWSLWALDDGGWLYPHQRDVFQFGFPLERDLISSISFGVDVPSDSVTVPPEVAEQFAAVATAGMGTLGRYEPGDTPRGGPAEPATLADGVVTIPGIYATTFVEQEDGVVVLDAPMTSAWSAAVFEEVNRRFPGERVKAVVTTSDAWLHIGGLREYAARGVPIYVLDLNVSVVRRLLQTEHKRDPDRFERNPRPPRLRPVTDSLTLGSGKNRLVLYPVRGEGGERMMLAYLPERTVLYASDLLQLQPDGSVFWPEYLLEIENVVNRHGLAPKKVFAMHTQAIGWDEFEALLAASRGEVARETAGGS